MVDFWRLATLSVLAMVLGAGSVLAQPAPVPPAIPQSQFAAERAGTSPMPAPLPAPEAPPPSGVVIQQVQVEVTPPWPPEGVPPGWPQPPVPPKEWTPPAKSVEAEIVVDKSEHYFNKLIGDYSRYRFLPNQNGGFGVQDLEFGYNWDAAWWRIPHCGDWMSFGGGLGFGVHWWEGPNPLGDEIVPDLPPRVYDLYWDIYWLQRVADWLAFDLMISPGLYGDFNTTPPQAFRLRGHAVGIVSLDYDFHVVGGFDYLNRDTIDALPVVGILWRPQIGVQCQLVFPRPRVFARLGQNGQNEWWGYVGGEFGGGAWAYKTDTGSHTNVEYNETRIVAGVELRNCSKYTRAHVEVGYGFDREINAQPGFASYAPRDSWLVSLWFSY